jgi:fructose-bisphosphate aldolase class I
MQEVDIVPIVEPEVLMEGNHSMQHCYKVTEQVLKMLFDQLYVYKVNLEGMILKSNMIMAGIHAVKNNSTDEVAEATVNCLLSSVPAAVTAIAFLSGGQSPIEASAHLNAINENYMHRLPWIVSFSFGRAIQQPALDIWKGQDSNVEEAQRLLYRRAKLDTEARQGQYKSSME